MISDGKGGIHQRGSQKWGIGADNGRNDNDWDGERKVNPNGRNKRTVWTVTPATYPGAHFAVYPPALIKPCILAGCPLGGVVVDPFFGSGTTGRVAESLGRAWYGVELNPEYGRLIAENTAQVGLL